MLGMVTQEWPRQTKPKKGQFMNFSQGHCGTKVQCQSCLFSQGETPEFTKMGEIHELFVLALSLVWFAGPTPELRPNLGRMNSALSVVLEGKELGPWRFRGFQANQSSELNFLIF